jgi:protease-4
MKTRWKLLIIFGSAVFLALTAGLIYLLIEGMEVNQLPLIGQKVAVIPLKGTITLEGCGGDIFGAPQCANARALKEMLRNADEDNSIKAIVLDINSGGGYVVATRELERAVRNTKKPVVACISEVGASGAYYVASAADHIVADRDSITGSIGVIMTIQHYYGLFEKLGINVTVIKAGECKDVGSPYREMTPEEERELQEMVDKIHQDFISDVAANRNLSISYVTNISDASIYLGSEAKDLHLVDSLGGLDDAIDIASELSGIIGEPAIERAKPRKISFLDLFQTSADSDFESILRLIDIISQGSNN